MSEKMQEKNGIERCAGCGKMPEKAYTGQYYCITSGCPLDELPPLVPVAWNCFAVAFRARRRADFEAGCNAAAGIEMHYASTGETNFDEAFTAYLSQPPADGER